MVTCDYGESSAIWRRDLICQSSDSHHELHPKSFGNLQNLFHSDLNSSWGFGSSPAEVKSLCIHIVVLFSSSKVI